MNPGYRMPFGKHKGEGLADCVQDLYAVWLASQESWLREAHPAVYAYAVREAIAYLQQAKAALPKPQQGPHLTLITNPLPAEVLEIL